MRKQTLEVGDSRTEHRHTTVFKVAKLTTSTRETLCLIRNLSPGGAKIETLHPLPVGGRVGLQWRSDRETYGTVRWSADGFAGIEFDPASAPMRLDHPDRAAGVRVRNPRFRTLAPATIRIADENLPGRLVNASLGGAALRISEKVPLRVGEIINVDVDGLGTLAGRIRWQRGFTFGIQFGAPLQFRTLAKWLTRGHPGQPAPSEHSRAERAPPEPRGRSAPAFGHAKPLSPARRLEPESIEEIPGFWKKVINEVAAMATIDGAGNIMSVNRLLCERSGYDAAELVGTHHRLLTSGEHGHGFFRDLYQTVSRGIVWRGAIRDRAKSGELYWTQTTVIPQLEPDASKFVVLQFDVSPS